MEKKVTLNNGTVLEVGEKYRLSTWSETFYVECIKIHNDKYVMMELAELDDIDLYAYDLRANHNWLPYIEPTPQKEWKTFMIETLSQKTDIPYKFFSQYYSMEDAREHHKRAISIQEVKLNIEPVNS